MRECTATTVDPIPVPVEDPTLAGGSKPVLVGLVLRFWTVASRLEPRTHGLGELGEPQI